MDLLERVTFENLAISVAAVCLSILLSLAWMKGLNGIFLAQFYVAEVGSRTRNRDPLQGDPFAPVIRPCIRSGDHPTGRSVFGLEKWAFFTERVHAMMAEPILKTEKVCKWYNAGRNDEIRAVQEISLEIMGNDSMVLYGPSGSGKTSLLGLMATIDRPTSGKIILMGQDVTQFSDAELSRVRRETIGFIFQSFNLFSGMPAWENVAYPLIPMGIRAKERYDRAAVLLERLGLGDRLHHSPEELSGGEQQRVAIARALINNPGNSFCRRTYLEY